MGQFKSRRKFGGLSAVGWWSGIVQCGREIVEEIYIFLNLVQELGSIIHDFQISNNLLQLKKKACIFLPSSHSNTHVFPPPSPYHPHFTRID